MSIARLAPVALMLSGAGCATLQPVSDPAAFISATNPQVVYATHNSGSVVAVAQPRISGDTLLGVRQGLSRPVALPLSHLRRIQAVQRDRTRTTVTVAGITTITAVVGFLLLQKTGDQGPSCDYSGVTHALPGCDDPRPGH